MKNEVLIIKPRVKVQLTSPTSQEVVALGTIQSERGDYANVLINMVLNSTTRLPEAQGRIKLMAHAQAHTIPWPKHNVSITKHLCFCCTKPCHFSSCI